MITPSATSLAGSAYSTPYVVGAVIGSGIFMVPAEMAREIGSAKWLLIAWVVAGALTIAGAPWYGELFAMMPPAGGMYLYRREAYSPLWGFLYGWTLFSVIEMMRAIGSNFSHPWSTSTFDPPTLGTTAFFGLFRDYLPDPDRSLFSAGSWHNIAFAAGEMKHAERNVTCAMVIGTIIVITLCLLANLSYLVTLPF